MKKYFSDFICRIKNVDFNFQLKMEKLKDSIKERMRVLKVRLKKIPFIYQLVLLKRKLKNKIVSSESYLKFKTKISNILDRIITPKVRQVYWNVRRSTGYKLCTRVFAIVVTMMIALVIMNAGLESSKSSASGRKSLFKVSSSQNKEQEPNKSLQQPTANGENKPGSTNVEENNVKPGATKEFVQIEDNTKWLENARKNTYLESNYKLVNGIMNYSDERIKEAGKGIDVSSHQKNIDWARVKKAGIKFAMIRVGARGYISGKIVMDRFFTRNIQEASRQGIHVGVYFFSQAVNEKEAIEEADFVINCVRKYNLTMPVAFDSEYIPDVKARTNTAGLNNEKRTDICIAFCERIKKAGYVPMIYDCKARLLGAYQLSRLNQYFIWYARYNSVPGYEYAYEIWQYTEHGKIDGINGYVDINLCMKSFPIYIQRLKNSGKTVVKSNSNVNNIVKNSNTQNNIGSKVNKTDVANKINNSNGIKPTPVPTPIPSVKPDLNPIEQTTQEPEYNENKSEEIVNEQDDLQNTGKIME